MYEQKQYAAASAILEELRRNPQIAALEDARDNVLYNLACNYSLLGDAKKAVDVLREAATTGNLSTANLRQDSDFDSIRKDPGFVKLLDELDAKQKPAQMLWSSPAMRTPYREDLPEDEKIAGLSLLWSEAKYNFAYFERLGGIDWDGQYLSYLAKVRRTKSTLEYYQTLAEFLAQLHDGHTNVNFPREARSRLGWPAINTHLVEGRVFVDSVLDPELVKEHVQRGSEIVEVDGIPAKQYGEQRWASALSASSPQGLAVKIYEGSLLSGPLEWPVKLTLRDATGSLI
ncbi:MAG: hypothetical protein LLG20_13635 [Acidobacteriales bacterium]|nr:hypothetical protein [Terriglobales bacterium]